MTVVGQRWGPPFETVALASGPEGGVWWTVTGSVTRCHGNPWVQMQDVPSSPASFSELQAEKRWANHKPQAQATRKDLAS